MTLIKLPEHGGPDQKETYVPPLGLWSMRGISPRTITVFDAHLHGRAAMDEFLAGRQAGELLGLSAQFQSQEAELSVAVMRWGQKFPIIAGGPQGCFTRIPGVWTHKGWGERYVNPTVTRLHEIPMPEFTVEEIEPYWNMGAPHGLKAKGSKWMTLETSRGCAYSCGFCGMPEYWGNWQPRPVVQIADYLDYLESMGIAELFIEDDNISFHPGRFRELISLFKRRSMWWSCPNGIYARSLLDKETMKALESSTCWSLSIPFETASPRSAELMNLGRKWLRPEEGRRLVDMVNGSGIESVGFFIIGYPGETEADVRMTLDYANSLPLGRRYVYFATPYPGTQMWEKVRANGLMDHGNASYKEPVISTDQLPLEKLYQIWKEDREAALKRKENAV